MTKESEIVKALKEMLPPKEDYAELVGAEAWAHGQHYVWTDPEPYQIEAAIDLIESLTAEIGRLTADCKYMSGEMLRANAAMASARLDAEDAQRRERAAVEDLYRIAACDACKHYDPDENACAKPMVESYKCFEWRGPQEAWKGE